MAKTEIKLLIFFVAKDRGAVYSQEKKTKTKKHTHTWSWLWLRSSASHSKIQSETKESGENH